jgi:hypothetical protein
MSPPVTHTGMPSTGNADAARWLGGQLRIPAQLNRPAGPAQPRRWSSSTTKMIQRDHFWPRSTPYIKCSCHYVSLSLYSRPIDQTCNTSALHLRTCLPLFSVTANRALQKRENSCFWTYTYVESTFIWQRSQINRLNKKDPEDPDKADHNGPPSKN